MIYNYVLCWLYSMTKSVVIALFCSLYSVGFSCIGFSIKLVKNRACIGWTTGFCQCLMRSLPAKEPHEKHMLEAEELCQAVIFTSVSRVKPSCKILAKHFACRILKVIFLPFTHTIYTLITHKSKREHSERKTLNIFSKTQAHLLERDLLILSEKSF